MEFVMLESRGGNYLVVAQNIAWLRTAENGQTSVGMVGGQPLLVVGSIQEVADKILSAAATAKAAQGEPIANEKVVAAEPEAPPPPPPAPEEVPWPEPEPAPPPEPEPMPEKNLAHQVLLSCAKMRDWPAGERGKQGEAREGGGR